MTVTTLLTYNSEDVQGSNSTGYPPLVADGVYTGSGIAYAEQCSYQTLFESATFQNLYVVIQQSTGFGSGSTWTLRKNSTNSSVAISILVNSNPATYSDTVDSASGNSGDTFNYACTETGASSSIFTATCCITMTSAHSTSWMNGAIIINGNGPLNYNSGTVYGMTGGAGDFNTTESNAYYKVRVPMHTFGLKAYIGTNTINGSTTITMRNSGANGNQSISIPASTTGSFTDSVDSDNFAYAGTVDYAYTPSGTSGSMSGSGVSTTCYGNDGISIFTGLNGWAGANTDPVQSVTPLWYAIAGDFAGRATELVNQEYVFPTATMFYLAMNIVNHLAGGLSISPVTSRVNGTNGNLSISPVTDGSGYYEDTVDSDVVTPGTLYDAEVAWGSSGTSQYYFYLSPTIMAQFPSPVPYLPLRISRNYRHHK